MTGIGDNSGMDGDAGGELLAFKERLLRLHEERDGITGDIKDVYAELKGRGFNKTAMGAIISEERKEAKNPGAVSELTATADLYRDAMSRAASRTHTHTRAGGE